MQGAGHEGQMSRGLKEKRSPPLETLLVMDSGDPLRQFLRILPQMASLGRIRAGKRYGALPLERSLQSRKIEGAGYSKTLKKTGLKLLSVYQSQLEICSITSDHVELTPLMEFILLGRTLNTEQLYKHIGHCAQTR